MKGMVGIEKAYEERNLSCFPASLPKPGPRRTRGCEKDRRGKARCLVCAYGFPASVVSPMFEKDAVLVILPRHPDAHGYTGFEYLVTAFYLFRSQ